jgi:hypothetical protein
MYLRRGVKTAACPLYCLKMYLSMMDLSEDESTKVGANGLQAGPVCSLEHLSTECLFKDTNVCCFCKNEKTCLAKLFAKAITSSAQIGLACCYGLVFIKNNLL